MHGTARGAVSKQIQELKWDLRKSWPQAAENKQEGADREQWGEWRKELVDRLTLTVSVSLSGLNPSSRAEVARWDE